MTKHKRCWLTLEAANELIDSVFARADFGTGKPAAYDWYENGRFWLSDGHYSEPLGQTAAEIIEQCKDWIESFGDGQH